VLSTVVPMPMHKYDCHIMCWLLAAAAPFNYLIAFARCVALPLCLECACRPQAVPAITWHVLQCSRQGGDGELCCLSLRLSSNNRSITSRPADQPIPAASILNAHVVYLPWLWIRGLLDGSQNYTLAPVLSNMRNMCDFLTWKGV
jgi:hypothetical protein